MGFLSGQGATLSVGSLGWTGDITRIRHAQTIKETQVKVMGQLFANTVTGAYHTVYTVDIAVQDGLAANDLTVEGTSGAITFTYDGGNDTLVLTASELTDVDIEASVDGAITGTLIIAGNSAMAHTGA